MDAIQQVDLDGLTPEQRFQHEFRTILTIIDLADQRLTKRRDNSDRQNVTLYARTIRDADARGTQLLVTGSSELDPTQFVGDATRGWD